MILVSGIASIALLLGYVPTTLGGLSSSVRADFIASALATSATVLGFSVAGIFAASQLQMERRERENDRLLTAKREILTDGIRGLHMMLLQINQLPRVNREMDEIQEAYNAGVALASPSYAVEKLATIRVHQDLSDDIGRCFFKLQEKRKPLVALNDEEVLSAKMHGHAITEADKLFAMQTQAIADNDTDKAKRLQELIDASFRAMPGLRSRRDKAQAELDMLLTPFALECLKDAARLRQKLRRFIAETRHEILIDKDTQAALNEFESASRVDMQAFVRMIKSVVEGQDDIIDSMSGDILAVDVFDRRVYPPARP